MKTVRHIAILGWLAGAITMASAAALDSSFNYQGRLAENGVAVTGAYDLIFQLYDTANGGAPVAGPVTNANVAVANGLFSAPVNFGAGVFTGTEYWLAISARRAGTGNFTELSPRQRLGAAPYALHAVNAALAAGVTSNGITSASLKDGAVTALKISAGQVVKSLNGLRDDLSLAGTNGITVTAAGNTLIIGGGASGGGWGLQGNAGTSPTQNFLGTTDNQPLELRVNNQRFLRALPTTNSPNLIGGSPENQLLAAPRGAVIAGGGAPAEPNVVGGDYGFIGSGRLNLVHSNANESAIAGGFNNTIYTNTWSAFIGGGSLNWLDSYSHFAVIAGGEENFISTNSEHAAIGGGRFNTVGAAAANGWIGGGGYNTIGAGAAAAGIASGRFNEVSPEAYASFIGGGIYNTNQGLVSFIGGGFSNWVHSAAYAGVIGGGEYNYIGDAYAATIAGGDWNFIGGADDATIAGGYYNYVEDDSHYATVSGGTDNWVKTNAPYSTIPGGFQASTHNYGQLAYASGMDNDWGDAQTSLYVLRRISTNAVQAELFLDGASRRMNIPAGGSWTFNILITARNASGNSAGFKAEGVIKNVNGTVSLVGTPTVTAIGSDIAGITAPTVQSDNVNKALIIRATGIAAQRIKWVARVETSELKF